MVKIVCVACSLSSLLFSSAVAQKCHLQRCRRCIVAQRTHPTSPNGHVWTSEGQPFSKVNSKWFHQGMQTSIHKRVQMILCSFAIKEAKEKRGKRKNEITFDCDFICIRFTIHHKNTSQRKNVSKCLTLKYEMCTLHSNVFVFGK